MAVIHGLGACHEEDTCHKEDRGSGGKRYSLGLWVFYIVTYIIPLGWRPLLSPDEVRYAQIGSMMQRSGELIVPHFLGLRYFEKPILGYWLNAASQWLLGSSNFSARFSCAIAAGLSALMVHRMAKLLWSDACCAACCTLAYLSMFIVYGTGTYNSIDAPMAIWTSMVMLSIVWAYARDTQRSRLLGFICVGIASGAGVMTKGFIALAVPTLVLTPWLLITHRWRHLVSYGPVAIVVAILTILPWGLAVQQRDPEFWSFFFWHEHIQRFFSQTSAQHGAPFYFFVPVLLIGLLPWWGSAFSFRQSVRTMNPATRYYVLLWIGVPFLFFSCARGKLAPYILPCFSGLGLLVGYTLYALYSQQKWRPLRWNGILIAAVALGGVLLLLACGGQYFDLSIDLTAYLLSLATLTCVALMGLLVAFIPRLIAILALMPTLLAWTVPFCMPAERIYDKAPAVFAQQHAELFKDSAVLASNGISAAAAMSWVTQRDDIVMYDTVGELEFGLSDHPERWVDEPGLPVWLWRMRVCGRISMMLDNDRDSFATAMQMMPDRVETLGSYSFLSFSAWALPYSSQYSCPGAVR